MTLQHTELQQIPLFYLKTTQIFSLKIRQEIQLSLTNPRDLLFYCRLLRHP